MNIIPDGAPPFILFSIYFAGIAIIVALKSYSKFESHIFRIKIRQIENKEKEIKRQEKVYKAFALPIFIFLIIRSLLENSESSNKYLVFSIDMVYVILFFITVFVILFKLMNMLISYLKTTTQAQIKVHPPAEEFEPKNQ